jgi:hypothetical protein
LIANSKKQFVANDLKSSIVQNKLTVLGGTKMQSSHINHQHQRRIDRSENYTLEARKRSAERHDLMDIAQSTQDNALWLQIGLALGRACDHDDLTPQVSDHFVEHCPDAVFLQVKHVIPREKFKYWRKRMDELANTAQ